MQSEIKAILSGLPDVRINQVATFWQISVGGLAGARADGVSLARDLKAQYEYRKEREALVPRPVHAYTADPEPVEIPAFLKPDPRDAKIAELEAALAAAAAPKPQPVSAHIPPAEIADLIVMHETPAQTHDRLMRLFMEAKQSEEIARRDGGTNGSFNGKTTMEWLRKAEHYDSGIKWNRGRLAETI